MIHHGIRNVDRRERMDRLDHMDRLDRRSVAPLAPFATIWGLELSTGAFVKYIWIWSAGWKVQLVFAVLAALASIVAWRRVSRRGVWKSASPLARPGFLALFIVAAAIIGVAILHLLGGHPMIAAFAAALVLVVGYLAASRRLGKPLMLLGLWLLALAAVVAVSYPGLAAVVLDFFSGLSLIVAGSMIRLWNRR